MWNVNDEQKESTFHLETVKKSEAKNMTSKIQRAQDLLVLKHSILMQQLETKYMEHVNALLTQKTKLMVALQNAYHQQLEDLEGMGRDSNGHGQITTKGPITSLHDVLCGPSESLSGTMGCNGRSSSSSNSNGTVPSNLDQLEQLISSSGLESLGMNLGLNGLDNRGGTASEWTVLDSILSNLQVQNGGSNGCPVPDANTSSQSHSEGSSLSMLSTRSNNEGHGVSPHSNSGNSNPTTLSMPEIDVAALQRLVLPNIDDLMPCQLGPLPAQRVSTSTNGSNEGMVSGSNHENGGIDRSPNEPRKMNHKMVKMGEYRPPPKFAPFAATSISTVTSTNTATTTSTTTTNSVAEDDTTLTADHIPGSDRGTNRGSDRGSDRGSVRDSDRESHRSRKRSRAVMEDEVSSESEDGDTDDDETDDGDDDEGHSDDDDMKDGHGDVVSEERKRERERERKRRRSLKKEHGESRRAKKRRKSSMTSGSGSSEDEESGKPSCVCRRPPLGKMIRCGNEVCKIGLFHISCMRLFKGTPTLKWYCKQCRRYPSKSSIIKPEFKNLQRNASQW